MWSRSCKSKLACSFKPQTSFARESLLQTLVPGHTWCPRQENTTRKQSQDHRACMIHLNSRISTHVCTDIRVFPAYLGLLCVFACISPRALLRVHVCMSVYLYVGLPVCLPAGLPVCLSVCLSVPMYAVCVYISVYACACLSACMYVCMYVCIYACMHVCM